MSAVYGGQGYKDLFENLSVKQYLNERGFDYEFLKKKKVGYLCCPDQLKNEYEKETGKAWPEELYIDNLIGRIIIFYYDQSGG